MFTENYDGQIHTRIPSLESLENSWFPYGQYQEEPELDNKSDKNIFYSEKLLQGNFNIEPSPIPNTAKKSRDL